MKMTADKVVEFVPLLNFEDKYEILNDYPFTIRRKNDSYKIHEWTGMNGYIKVWLNGRNYFKHLLIANQFIKNDNPEHLTEVDHINHNRTDYHIENLRWVSHSDNQKNRCKSTTGNITYNYIDEIPSDSITVDTYNNHEFEFYYYSESSDEFYFYNGCRYKILYVNEMKGTGTLYVIMISKLNKPVKICINKFKALHDIPF